MKDAQIVLAHNTQTHTHRHNDKYKYNNGNLFNFQGFGLVPL